MVDSPLIPALSSAHAVRSAVLLELSLLIAAEENIESLLQRATKKAMWVLDFQRCCLALANDEPGSYRLRTVIETREGEPLTSIESVATSDGVAGRVMRTGQPIVLSSGAAIREATETVVDPPMEKGTLDAVLAVPLYSSGRILGALVFGKEGSVYNRSDVGVARVFGTLLAGAVDRLQQVERLDRARAELASEIDVRRRAEEQLEQRVRERTEELEAFTHTVSHDLRSPLVTLNGFIRLLQRDHGVGLDTRGQQYLARIARAAARMGALIDDLLIFSRLSRGGVELAPVIVAEAVSAAMEQLATEVATARITVEISDLLPPVMAHRETLTQALGNLISNAVKYGGRAGRAEVRVWAKSAQQNLRISVADNGDGIPQEHHERIFEVFERAPGSESHSGSGLGLSIVKKAVERMGGRVGLKSAPRKGTTFWIELPAASYDSTGSS